MKNRFDSILRLGLLFVLLTGSVLQPQYPAYALATLSVTPLTWNVIGLDSNNVSVGPNHFPIGAHVCNTSPADTATNVKSAFVFDDGLDLYTGNAYVNLRQGTLPAYTSNGINLAPGACTDFYYEVEVTRNSTAYNKTRSYHITASSDAGAVTGSTPTPRELFVEHLVSQSRNAVIDVQLDGVSIPAGGTMSLMLGNTYTIKLVGYTATQGYNQLESFINFPNTIFQVLSVTSTYTAGTSPIDKLYADACGWDNISSSPTYRSCIVSDNKSGGSVTVTYQVKILQVPSAPLVNPEPLSTLLYDFSGSSYHYNSDYSISTRYAQIIDPASAVSIAKTFSPNTIPPGGTSTLTVTLTNSASVMIDGANFSDTLPILSGSQMVVATPATYSTSGCGSAPTLSFTPVAGASSFSVSGATIAPNGSCTITLGVSVPSTPTTGTYQNTITNFRVGNSPTAGITSNTANLTVNSSSGSVGTGICGRALAQWNFPTGFSLTSPAPYAPNTTVTASASLGGGITIPVQGTNDHTVTPANTFSWGANGGIDSNTTTLNLTFDDYFQFAINTTGYSSVDLTFYAQSKPNNGPQGVAVYVGTTTKTAGSASDPGTQLYSNATVLATQNTWYPITITNITNINASGTTYFRIYGFNSNNISNGFDIYLDDVTYTGCGPALKPTLTKTFNTNPVAVSGTSTLSFTITNPNASTLNGLQFTDVLPAGLTITNSGPTAVCGGTLTTTAATGTITFTGGVLASGASCTITTPAVTATTSGPHPNVSGFISSTESGTNSTSTGSAKASLVAVLPPTIEKVFNPNPILPGQTTTLTFTVINPNPSDALPNVAFSDTFPTMPGNMVVATTPNASTLGCGAPTFAPVAGAGSISFSNGMIAAGGTCTVKVDVTVPAVTTGAYANTSSAATTTIGGLTRGTDTASSTLTVNPPHPAIAINKQVSASASGPWSSYVSVPAGATVYYRLVVENTGDVPLSTVTVTDPLLTLCTNAQWQTSNASWPTLPVASPTQDPTATCTVSVTSMVGDHPNTATATGVYNSANYTNNDSATYVGVTPPDVVKSFSPNPILPGGTSTLSIVISNPVVNTVALTGVGFNDTLTGMQVATTPNATTTGCGSPTFAPVAGATSLSFSGGTIAVGGTCTITVDITAAVNGSYPNTVTVSTTNGGTSVPSTGTLTVTPVANLSVTKSSSAGGTVNPGSPITYTVTITNTGSAAQNNIVVSDAQPTGTSYVNGSSLATGYVIGGTQTYLDQFSATQLNNSNGTVAWGGTPWSETGDDGSANTGKIQINASTAGVADFQAIAAADVLTLTRSVNLANAASATLTYSLVENGINSAADTVIVQAWNGTTWTTIATYGGDFTSANANINILSYANAGTQIRFVVTGYDGGTQNLTLDNVNVQFTAAIATAKDNDPFGGVSGSLINGSPPTLLFAGDSFDLLAGQSMTVSYQATVNNPVTGGQTQVINTASVTSDETVVPLQATVTDNINLAPDLIVTKSNTVNGLVAQSGTFNWTITVTNSGNGTASFANTNVILSDPLPGAAGYYPQGALTVASGATPPTGTINCSIAGTVLSCVANGAVTLPVGASFIVTVPVTPTAAGSLVNTATVDPGGVVAESNEANNSASNTVGVVNAVKTIVSTSESSTSFIAPYERVVVGEIVRYRLTTYLPEGTWTNVQVTDAIDTGIQFLSGSATVSYVCDGICTNSAFTTTPGTFGSSTDPTFTLGTISNPDNDANAEYLVIEFNALVLNMASNAAGGVTRDNSYSISFNGTTITSPAIGVRISEPSITNLVKAVSPAAGPYYPGDTITYTLTYSNGSTGVTRATAFDVFTTDILSANLNLQSVSVTAPTGSTVTNTSTTGLGGVVRVLVSQVPPSVDIASGPTGVTITVIAQIAKATPSGLLSNTANLTYTSLPGGTTTGETNGTCANATGSCTPGTSGSLTGERNGAGASPNTYADTSAVDITVTPRADLSLTKIVNNATPSLGANVTFTITVANAGPSDATNVVVSDLLPAGLTYISSTPSQGTYTSGTGLWTVGTVNSGANATLDIVATVSTIGAKTNAVQIIASDQVDPDSTPNDNSTTHDDDDTVTVTPVTLVIDAVNDDFSGTSINGYVGGAPGNAFTNDTLNGVVVVPAQITATVVTPATNAGVTLNTNTGSVDVAAGTPAGIYTIVYQICENLNPTNCDNATLTIVVAPPVIDAVNDDYGGTPISGNTGGNAGNAFTNDTLNGVAVIPAQIIATVLTPASSVGVTLNTATGSVDVAAGTPAGTYDIVYRICELINSTNCDTATVTVVVSLPVIDAVNDNFGGTPINGYIGGTTATVYTNDTLNGAPFVPADVTPSITNDGGIGVTINANGTLNVPAGTPAGTYTVTYQICETANLTNCDTATATIVVNPPAINAVDDNYGATALNGYVGGNAGNAFTDDTLNGVAVIPAQITATVVTPATNAGVTLNTATGSVDVAAGTPAGAYTIVYQICENLNPTNCDTATITVVVVPPVIDAVNDDYSSTPVNGYVGGNAGNAFTNDTLNGVAVVPAQITVTVVTLASNAGVTLNTSTGNVDVLAGTPAGTYTIDYRICENLNPTNCDNATITVVVNPPAIDAVNDDYSGAPVSGYTGGNAGNVFVNDTLNGAAIIPAQITATVVTPASDPGVTLNTATGSVDVVAGTPAGTYTIVYRICEILNPTNCDNATITVVVDPPAIDAVNDNYSGASINGSTGGNAGNAFTNDTLNGVAVVPAQITATIIAPSSNPGVTLNPATGSVDVAAGTPAGAYTIVYQICESLNPTNCDNATITVVVNPPAIDAVNDDYSGTPIDGSAGGNAGNAFTNDTLNGVAVVPAQITATISTPASNPGVTLNTTTGSVDVAAGTPAGTYSIVYQICENLNPANCDTATVTVVVNPPASIGGVVFHDANLDGSKAGSEAGLAGVTVQLYDGTGTTLIAITTTGSGGTYNFPNLTPGSYRVIETDPAGYVSSTANSVPVTIAAGGTGTANFGDYQLPNTALSNISGVVFNDINGNGIQDAGELPLNGVTVELKNNLGVVIGTVSTNALGTYSFTSLPAGTYTVVETDLPGYVSTTLNTVTVNLSAGTNATVHFGDQVNAALIADPAVTKFGSPANAVVGDTVVYTITVGNNGNTNANNVILTDTKPSFLDIVSITISPNPGLAPVISGNTFTINFGTVTPTDSYTITVLTRVNALGVPPGGANTVQLATSSATDRSFNNTFAAGLVLSVTTPATSSLPATGFAPNVKTELSPQPQDLKYATTDITMEIPSLGVNLPVVGVPKKNGTWDVTWLGNQAGWLEGTAFPSWDGNSVLTSHVYLSNGLPGPFVSLNKLKYGDKVIVHAYGQKYTFEVRTNTVVEPNDVSIFKHEEKSWLTLVTCKEYDQKTNTYKKRVAIRAVLVKAEAE